MQALGLIETKGLIAAIESADAMLKSANVNLLEKTLVGGGLVTIAVVGDVGAVKAAVEAGESAVKQISETLLVSKHVIPRPHPDIDGVIVGTPKIIESIPDVEPELTIMEEKSDCDNATIDVNKTDIDTMVEEANLEEAMEVLSNLPVVKLRKLARQYTTLGIAGREISKADKELLMTKFREYYN